VSVSTTINSALLKSIPNRTLADWKDVKPRFFEIDFVERCGGVAEGTLSRRDGPNASPCMRANSSW